MSRGHKISENVQVKIGIVILYRPKPLIFSSDSFNLFLWSNPNAVGRYYSNFSHEFVSQSRYVIILFSNVVLWISTVFESINLSKEKKKREIQCIMFMFYIGVWNPNQN